MADNLTNFILDLAEKPQLLGEFENDPELVMTRAGLSSAERALLNSRNPKAITEAIIREITPGIEASADWTIVVVLVAVTTKTPQMERLGEARQYEQLLTRLKNLANKTLKND